MRPEVTGRKPSQSTTMIDADALSIDEFCARHSISRTLFYKLRLQGLMPATFKLGTRVLISREAAAAWRRAREAAATAA
ncbi:putative DNA-binding transcriptional regulator AlpA [Bradyrhizobium huanghuaihaiense]